MSKPTYEQLEAAIREGADQERLLRMLGPTPEEIAEAVQRLKRIEDVSQHCEWGTSHPSAAAQRARETWNSLMARQTDFENRYF